MKPRTLLLLLAAGGVAYYLTRGKANAAVQTGAPMDRAVTVPMLTTAQASKPGKANDLSNFALAYLASRGASQPVQNAAQQAVQLAGSVDLVKLGQLIGSGVKTVYNGASDAISALFGPRETPFSKDLPQQPDVPPYTLNGLEVYNPATGTWTANGSANEFQQAYVNNFALD